MLEHLDVIYQTIKASPVGTMFHPSTLMTDYGLSLSEVKVVVLAALAESLIEPVYKSVLATQGPWVRSFTGFKDLGANDILVAFRKVPS